MTILIKILVLLTLISCSNNYSNDYWSLAFIESSLNKDKTRVTNDYPIRTIFIVSDKEILVTIGDYGYLSGSGKKIKMTLKDGYWVITEDYFDS